MIDGFGEAGGKRWEIWMGSLSGSWKQSLR